MFNVPNLLSPYFQWHGDIISKQLARTQSLWHGNRIALDRTAELSYRIQSDITLQCTGNPRANTHIFC